MKISEASKVSGFSIETLRYYDKVALVSPVKEGKDRAYSEEDLERLRLIQILKAANFTLEEIKELFVFDEKYDTEESIYQMDRSDYGKIQNLLLKKEQAIKEQLRTLRHAQSLIEKMRNKMSTLEDTL